MDIWVLSTFGYCECAGMDMSTSVSVWRKCLYSIFIFRCWVNGGPFSVNSFVFLWVFGTYHSSSFWPPLFSMRHPQLFLSLSFVICCVFSFGCFEDFFFFFLQVFGCLCYAGVWFSLHSICLMSVKLLGSVGWFLSLILVHTQPLSLRMFLLFLIPYLFWHSQWYTC